MAATPATGLPFWAQPLSELRRELGAPEAGLDDAEAAARLRRHGANETQAGTPRAALRQLGLRLVNPLLLTLLAACVVSAALGDLAGAAVIAAILAGSLVLDFVQEHRAGRAAERLRRSVALQARVLRGGRWTTVPAATLVPGDQVQLAAGDRVPADGRVLQARDFFVGQSLLTGESFPVEKHARDLDAAMADPVDAVNAAFMGSSVLSGSATLLVCRTGRSTSLGDIAETLRRPPAPTAFERGTRRVGLLLLRVSMVLVLAVVLAHTVAGRPVGETFLFAVALAVGMTPELLPMIVSVTLARGALRMAARQVVVKRLAAIQDLGAMDVLCTDKTGTLTEAAVRVERHCDATGADSPRVLQLAVLNSRFETGLRSPLDAAILAHAGASDEGWTKLDEVPFGFARRRVSVLVERAGERLVVVKGAPEDLLPLCTRLDAAGATAPLDAAAHTRALAQVDAMGRDGLRVLAIAWRTVGPDHAHAEVGDESQLVLAGFVAFADPPKAGAAEALQRLQRSHVRVKVLTGDSEGVTRHLCARLGLPVARVLTGAQVERLDDPALAALAPRTDAFCRVTPQQKHRIVQALRRRGHVVGFLGDGVNDAPSLHDADVGISVDAAVDVAKEAADLILLQRDLGVLHEAVVEGRRTFANVMKYLMMVTSSNFGNMLSVAVASLFLPFLPLLPKQILLNNLLYDLSEVPLPRDRVDARETASPHDWDPDALRRFMLAMGPVSSLFDLLTFGLLLVAFDAAAPLFRTGWFIESMATQVLVVFVVRTRGAPWRSRPDPWLAATSVAVVGLAVALPFTPLAAPLGFAPPPPAMLAVLAAVVAGYLVGAEFAKRRFHDRHRRRRHAGLS